MISITKVVIRMKSWIPQTVEWREATAQMNKTPDTMKMDLGQNILEISPLIFFEAKASWVYTRLAHKKCPNLAGCTLLSTKLHQTWKNL